jgi:hypothetical protein
MRVPRPRFTLRWLMLAIAIAAMLFSSQIFRERSRRFDRLAREFAMKEDYAVKFNRQNPGPSNLEHWINTKTGSFEVKPKNASYYSLMRMKYDRISKYHWLPVQPDPPEPK